MTLYLVLRNGEPVRVFNYISLAVIYVQSQLDPETYKIETVGAPV